MHYEVECRAIPRREPRSRSPGSRSGMRLASNHRGPSVIDPSRVPPLYRADPAGLMAANPRHAAPRARGLHPPPGTASRERRIRSWRVSNGYHLSHRPPASQPAGDISGSELPWFLLTGSRFSAPSAAGGARSGERLRSFGPPRVALPPRGLIALKRAQRRQAVRRIKLQRNATLKPSISSTDST